MANTRRGITWWVGSENRQDAREQGYWSWIRHETIWIKNVEKFLWKSIRAKKLLRQLRQAFQVTKPLWFGLWMDSPLSVPRCSLLASLLSDIYVEEEAVITGIVREQAAALEELRVENPDLEAEIAEYNERMESARSSSFPSLNDLRRLISALETCAKEDTPLYVEVNPPGHTDFGLYTIFAHCPRCKADTPDKYSWNQEVACTVCGFRYCPNKTSSKTEIKIDWSKWKSSAKTP